MAYFCVAAAAAEPCFSAKSMNANNDYHDECGAINNDK